MLPLITQEQLQKSITLAPVQVISYTSVFKRHGLVAKQQGCHISSRSSTKIDFVHYPKPHRFDDDTMAFDNPFD